MKNSIYTTTAGMLTSVERLNTAANNLANFSTTGYKGDITFEQTLKFFAEGPYPGKDQPILGEKKRDRPENPTRNCCLFLRLMCHFFIFNFFNIFSTKN